MASQSWSSDDNIPTSSQPPQLPPENHNNTSIYRNPGVVRFTSSHRATPRPGSHPFLRANNPINLSPSQNFQVTQGRRMVSTRRLAPSGVHLSTRGREPDRHHLNLARVQTGEGQSTSGSSNTTPWRQDRHQGPQASTEFRQRRDRRKLQQSLQRRLDDNLNPAASQSMEVISVLDTRYEGRVTVGVKALFCRGQRYSVVHPHCLERFEIEAQDVPPGTGRKFFTYTNGLCYTNLYTNLTIEHPPYEIWAKSETFYVLGKEVPYKGIDLYLGQRFLDEHFDGNLPPHLPSESAASGQARHWSVGTTGSSQSVISSEDITLNIATSGNGLGFRPVDNAPAAPMAPLLVPIWDTTGTLGYSTAPRLLEQWETSPDLPRGVQDPIRPNDFCNGAAFGTQPNMGQFQPLNTTRLNTNGPVPHYQGQSPSPLNQGYLGENMMPHNANHGSNSHWCQAPE